MSAPGKVLVAGGYLILDPNQIGLAIAVSARICILIEREENPSSEPCLITVISPQFTEAEWKYQVSSFGTNGLEIHDLYSPHSS